MQIKHHPFTYDVRSNLFHKTFLHPPFVFGSPANLWCDETSLVLHFCLSTPENWNNLQQNQIFRYSLFFFSSIKSAKTKSVNHLFFWTKAQIILVYLYTRWKLRHLLPLTILLAPHYLQPSLLLFFKNVYTFSSVFFFFFF